MPYKFLEHTADVKIEVTEKTLEKAFATSSLALKESIAGKIKIASKIKKEIHIEGADLNALLYRFLEEFLYLLDAESFVLSGIKRIKIKKDKKLNQFALDASISGDSASNYKFTNDVKAVTYNEMSIKQEKGKVVIIFVLDV